jgi:hypothetical protein
MLGLRLLARCLYIYYNVLTNVPSTAFVTVASIDLEAKRTLGVQELWAGHQQNGVAGRYASINGKYLSPSSIVLHRSEVPLLRVSVANNEN